MEKKTAFVRGSALAAMEDRDEDIGKKAILELMDAVDKNVEVPERDIKKPFMLPIESVYSIAGRGTVATGKVLQGTIKLNDEIEVFGFNDESIKTNVTGIEMFNKTVDKGMAGDNLGILLKGLTKDQVRRGQIVSLPKTLSLSKEFVAECYLLSKEEGGRHTPFFSGFQPQFFFSHSWY